MGSRSQQLQIHSHSKAAVGMGEEEELERRMRSFSREGWNGNGARLLAVACSLATARNSSLKMNFAGRDIFLCVLLSLVIKFIPSPIPALIAAAFSLSYIVKKLLAKHRLEDAVRLWGKETQKCLVLHLMDYCEVAAIDVESLAELAQLVNHAERSEQMFGVVKQ